jgi:tripartite-type tricarboxylate transporter receptor subunit TctC
MERLAMIERRLLPALAGLVTAPSLARAQSWPTRPLRLVVGYPPGGAVDLAGRLIAEALGARLGQPVAVENRTGAGGTIGTAAVATAAPDGYTLGASAVNSLCMNQYLYRDMPYDPEKDLVPVSLGWEAPLVVVVPADHVPAQTLAELVTWAKKQRDGIAFGSSGVGTTVHLSGEMLCRRTGIQGIHVPFRPGSEALTGMLRGDIQMTVDNLPTALSNLRGGRLRALAVTSATFAGPARRADHAGGRDRRLRGDVLRRHHGTNWNTAAGGEPPVRGDAPTRSRSCGEEKVPPNRQYSARHHAAAFSTQFKLVRFLTAAEPFR